MPPAASLIPASDWMYALLAGGATYEQALNQLPQVYLTMAYHSQGAEDNAPISHMSNNKAEVSAMPPPPIPRGTAGLAAHTIPSMPAVPGIKPLDENKIIRARPTKGPDYQARRVGAEGPATRQELVLTPAPTPPVVNLIENAEKEDEDEHWGLWGMSE
eukprot:4161830-Amphidinium_carterae.1